jgi:hypothetical protein
MTKNGPFKVARFFAATCLIIVLLASSWAFYTDVSLLNSAREHLAPDVLLLIVTLPSSSGFTYLCATGWEVFSEPIGQVAWLTLFGLGQAWLLFALISRFQKAANGYHIQ